MFLTLHRPNIVAQLGDWAGGLWAIAEGLVIKISKESILAAKVREGFAVYLAPVQVAGVNSHVLVTAFFDNEDEPLACRTPLLNDDVGIEALIVLLSKPSSAGVGRGQR